MISLILSPISHPSTNALIGADLFFDVFSDETFPIWSGVSANSFDVCGMEYFDFHDESSDENSWRHLISSLRPLSSILRSLLFLVLYSCNAHLCFLATPRTLSFHYSCDVVSSTLVNLMHSLIMCLKISNSGRSMLKVQRVEFRYDSHIRLFRVGIYLFLYFPLIFFSFFHLSFPSSSSFPLFFP